MLAGAVPSLVPINRALKKLLGAPCVGGRNLCLGEQSCGMTGELTCVCNGRKPDELNGVAEMVVSDARGDRATKWRE